MKRFLSVFLCMLFLFNCLPVSAENDDCDHIAATLFATEEGIQPRAEMDCGNYADGIHKAYSRWMIDICSTSGVFRYRYNYYRCACGYAIACSGNPTGGHPVYYYFELDTVGWYDGIGNEYRTDAQPFYTTATSLPCVQFRINPYSLREEN